MFNLDRFIKAQDLVYHKVVAELEQGKKQSHWMWYVFPQLNGLGQSEIARHYSLNGLAEANAYYAQPILKGRLLECCQLTLAHTDKTALAIFGYPDELKLRSCVTLFSQVSAASPVFMQLLECFFAGKADPLTLSLLS